jgi:hypothetical protein
MECGIGSHVFFSSCSASIKLYVITIQSSEQSPAAVIKKGIFRKKNKPPKQKNGKRSDKPGQSRRIDIKIDPSESQAGRGANNQGWMNDARFKCGFIFII